MPAYDYRCKTCGAELEITHKIKAAVSEQEHQDPETGAVCTGPLEQLVSSVGLAHGVGTKGPSDSKLQSLGFTKYVRGSKGYDKVFGKDIAPKHIDRE